MEPLVLVIVLLDILIFRVLRFVRLHDVKVGPFFGGPPSCFIPIKRGVKQGCPLSPLLFIVSYDPLLTSLRSSFPVPPTLTSTTGPPFYPVCTPCFHFNAQSSFVSPLLEVPCSASGPDGSPCPLVTRYHAPDCATHTESLLGLRVPSRIPVRLGLFASRDSSSFPHCPVHW